MKIIAGTDFSSLADHAVEMAFALAERLGDELEIIHVIEPPPSMIPELAVQDSQMMMSLDQAANARLESYAQRFGDKAASVRTKTLSGIAEEILPSYAASEGARLLTLGTHGRKGAMRFFIGSVAERIVRRAHVPLMIVPPAAELRPTDRTGAPRPLRIVAGVDASPSSDAALAWIRTFTASAPSDVSLVHVYWPLRELARFGLDDAVDAHEGREEITRLLSRELRPRIETMLGPDASRARLQLRPTLGRDADPLVHEVELMAADLLVVGTSQRHDRWGGSTAVAAIRSARSPVICVPTIVAGMPRPAPQKRALRTLLVPVDLTDASRGPIALAFQMLRAAGGVVQLLHVVKPTREGLTSQRVSDLERHLSEYVPDREDHTILARPNFVESDMPAQAILQTAERLDVDAIVLASHGHTGLKHALGGAVVEHVVRGAKRPVMVVPVGEWN